MDRLALVLALLLASASVLAQPETSPYQQALDAERVGNMQEAVRHYVRAARSGEARAARRLSEIYDKGIGGIQRDYAQSLKWDNAARTLGEPMIGDFPERKRGY